MLNKDLGAYCRWFRKNILLMTLKEFAGDDVSIKTISGFENGRSTNITHLFRYAQYCESDEMREMFFKNLKSYAKDVE